VDYIPLHSPFSNVRPSSHRVHVGSPSTTLLHIVQPLILSLHIAVLGGNGVITTTAY